jgi:hypothetical protein
MSDMRIFGKLKDEQGNPVLFANIYVSDENGVQIGTQGTSSNQEGNYSLTFQNAEYITFSAVGYKRFVFKLPSNFGEQKKDVTLAAISYDVTPVVIEADRIKPGPKKDLTWLYILLASLGILAVGVIITVAVTRKKNQ